MNVGSFTGPFSLPFELGCDPLGTQAPELAALAGLRPSASPNPVAAATTIRFQLAAESRVEVALYDAGRRLASGVYFVRLAADGVRETRKLVLLR